MIFNMIFGVAADESTPTPTPTPDPLILYEAGNENVAFDTFAPANSSSTGVMYEGETAAVLRSPPHGCKKGTDALEIYWKQPNRQAAWGNGAFGTKTTVDLSSWTTLHIKATKAESTGGTANYHVFGVTSSKSPTGNNTPPGTYKTLGVGETTLDISALSSGYIYFGGMLRSNAISGTEDRHVHIVVTKIWLT